MLVEFVSANPTGPLVAASGRHAAYGDALSRVLEHHGHEVWREYYFNDAGSQIRRLGESVLARARGEDAPEGGYQGEYVRDLAAQIPGVEAMSVDEAAAARGGAAAGRRSRPRSSATACTTTSTSPSARLHEGSPSYLDRALEVGRAGRQLL